MIYQPKERFAGFVAKVCVIGPANAYLVEGVHRSQSHGATNWVDVNIGAVWQHKELSTPMDWRFGDPDDALRPAVFVTNGPGDQWQIDEAEIVVTIHQIGMATPLVTVACSVSPIGEDPKQRALGRVPI